MEAEIKAPASLAACAGFRAEVARRVPMLDAALRRRFDDAVLLGKVAALIVSMGAHPNDWYVSRRRAWLFHFSFSVTLIGSVTYKST